MEHNPWAKWSSSDLEIMDHDVNECLCHTITFDEEFLRDILQQPQEYSSTTTTTTAAPVATTTNNTHSQLVQQNAAEKTIITSSSSSSPTTFILSFDKSTALLPTHDDEHDIPIPNSSVWKEVSPQLPQSGINHHHPTNSLSLCSSRPNQAGTNKKARSASETLDHIISERNRRQELTRKFIALSATIPGLKKMDKAHVLREAINYVKQLQERVKELEEDMKKNGGVESVITIARSHLCIEDDTATEEECYGLNEALPEVEARVLGTQVLIKIHCGKQKGILLNIMSQLERLHLSITTTNVLPFGNTLDITIIAQMGDKDNLIVKDLVKDLRVVATVQACNEQQ